MIETRAGRDDGKRDVEMGGEESEGAGDETERGTNVAK